jgi:hypothetical protein
VPYMRHAWPYFELDLATRGTHPIGHPDRKMWGAMSLRAELVRLGARWFIKRHGPQKATIAQMRRRAAAAERLVPGPSAETETLDVDAGGVRAERVTTPASQQDRVAVDRSHADRAFV